MLEINRKFWCKNDRFMMGVLYGGVWGFGGGRCIITTTLTGACPSRVLKRLSLIRTVLLSTHFFSHRGSLAIHHGAA